MVSDMTRKEKRDRKNANHRKREKRRGVVKSIKRFTATGGAKRVGEALGKLWEANGVPRE